MRGKLAVNLMFLSSYCYVPLAFTKQTSLNNLIKEAINKFGSRH
jgi:hypothetical protein